MSASRAVQGFSGIVINQNQVPQAGHSLTINDNAWRFQEFALPDNYVRGSDSTEVIIPDLSGIQLLTTVTDSENAQLEWTLDYYTFGTGWGTLLTGVHQTAVRAATKVWLSILFEDSLPIAEEQIASDWRIGFRVPVASAVTQVWYSQPNPLALSFDALRAANGTTAIQPNGSDVSICFRVLGLVADDGVDFLGNQYRSALTFAAPQNTTTRDGAAQDKIWLSKPSPSRFAVESLYYDVRPQQPTQYNPITHTAVEGDIEDDTSVIDHVMVDPITPGVWFSVYYSNEGEPGTSDDEWEQKLWTRVPASFNAIKRQSHFLPEPIVAKYVKIEFTHLQAKFYSPGDFAQPVAYKKHPKWVLDYFLARLDDALTPARRVAVTYDALKLAYDYYLDDLDQTADEVTFVNQGELAIFLRDRTNAADQVDAITLSKINLSLRPYQETLSTWTKDTLTAAQAALANSTSLALPVDNPIERSEATIPYADVNTVRNEAVVFEQAMPVMFFYLTSRHKYREVQATFDHDRAYFVGIREIAFTRETYMVATDNQNYMEPGADFENIERNDFVLNENGVLEV